MPVVRQTPRALVSLEMVVQGRDVQPAPVVVPRKVTLTRRPHTQADTCDVELDGIHVPFDLRTVDALLLTVFLANASDLDALRTERNARFVGYVDAAEGEQGEDDTITLKARDLSAVLRDTKPIPAAAIPRHSDTLRMAILRVLDTVPGGEALSILETGDLDILLGSLVPRRMATGHVHVDPNGSAWAAIEHVCGLANRMVSVDGMLLIVREPAQAYAHRGEPAAVLEFNTSTANLLRLKAEKKFLRNRKGLRALGWDPATRTRIEAVYPPDDQLPQRGRPRSPRSRAAPRPPEREVLAVGGVTTETALRAVVRGVWEERSRQELSLECESPWFDEPFLALKNGDRVRIELNRALAAGLNRDLPFSAQARSVARRLSVTLAAAEVLVRAAQRPATDLFYVHTATTNWGSESDTGVKLELINLIAVEEPRVP